MASSGRTPASRPAGPRPVGPRPLEVVPSGVDYPHVLRTPSASVGMSLLGVVVGLLTFVTVAPLVTQGLAALFWLAVGRPGEFADTYRMLVAYEHPFGLVAGHLGIAMLIPISAGLLWVLHRVRPAYLVSVVARVRWPLFWLSLGVAAVVLNGLLLAQNAADGRLELTPTPQAGAWVFIAVVLVTSPLQAAAEEVFFRGYLMQAFGSMVATPWFGILASAAVFAGFHGVQNVPLFLDRFAFGVLAGWLVVKTGGLEAGIAAHVVNNIFAFVYAALTTSVAGIKAVSEVGWIDAAWDIARFGLFAAVAFVVARRLRVETTTAGPDAASGRASGSRPRRV